MLMRLLLLAVLIWPAGEATAAGPDALRSFISSTATAQGEFNQKVYDR